FFSSGYFRVQRARQLGAHESRPILPAGAPLSDPPRAAQASSDACASRKACQRVQFPTPVFVCNEHARVCGALDSPLTETVDCSAAMPREAPGEGHLAR